LVSLCIFRSHRSLVRFGWCTQRRRQLLLGEIAADHTEKPRLSLSLGALTPPLSVFFVVPIEAVRVEKSNGHWHLTSFVQISERLQATFDLRRAHTCSSSFPVWCHAPHLNSLRDRSFLPMLRTCSEKTLGAALNRVLFNIEHGHYGSF
jgi:hypothetical protein